MRTREELRLLAGAEFTAVLDGDPELKRLNAQKFDDPLDRRVLLEFLELGDWRIGELPVRPLTIAKWAFLWLLKSPIVLGGKWTEADTDIAFYLLARDLRKIPGSLSGIAAEANGYTRATGLPFKAAAAELRSVVRGALRPLSMMPESPGDGDEPPHYDAVWCAGIAGAAARESNTEISEVLYRMPMSAVCAYFVAWRRRESVEADTIRCRPSADVERQMNARVEALADEWLSRRAAKKQTTDN